MSRYIDVSNLDIPSDENDYDELVAFADKVAKMITDAPSIDIEPKRGEWNFIGSNMFECSQCGVSYTTQQLDGLRNYSTDPFAPNFCPNCGADMREREGE